MSPNATALRFAVAATLLALPVSGAFAKTPSAETTTSL